jgi:hypothetical protein
VSEKIYRRYVEVGPSGLSEKETSAALDFRDHNPREALEVEARFARETREAEEKADMRDAWLKDGGDPADFEAVHKKITAEAKAERLRKMDEEAKEAMARTVARGF